MKHNLDLPDYFHIGEEITTKALELATERAKNDPEIQLAQHVCTALCPFNCQLLNNLMQRKLTIIRRQFLYQVRCSELPVPVQQEFLRRARVHIEQLSYVTGGSTTFSNPPAPPARVVMGMQHICLPDGISTLFGPLGAHKPSMFPGPVETLRSCFRHPHAWAVNKQALFYVNTYGKLNDLFVVAPDETFAKVVFAQMYRIFGDVTSEGPDNAILFVEHIKDLPDIDDQIIWCPAKDGNIEQFSINRTRAFPQPGVLISDRGLQHIGLEPLIQAPVPELSSTYVIDGKTYMNRMPNISAFVYEREQDFRERNNTPTHVYIEHLVKKDSPQGDDSGPREKIRIDGTSKLN